MAGNFKMTVQGDKETVTKLKAINEKMKRKIVGKATTAAIRPMLGDARQEISVRTGFSKKTLATKVKVYPSGQSVGMVGSQKGVKFVISGAEAVKVTKRSTRKAVTLTLQVAKPKMAVKKQIIYAPARILHLINRRTHFMESAFESSRTQSQTAFAEVVKQGVEGGG